MKVLEVMLPGFCLRLKAVWIISFILNCGGEKTEFVTQYTAPQDAVLGSSFNFKWTYKLAADDSLNFIQLELSNPPKTILVYVAPGQNVDFSRTPARYKGRITWTGDLQKFLAHFVLQNITLDDESNYHVTINYNKFLKLENNVNLRVLEPAHFTVSPPSSQSLTEGQDLTLKCEAGGKPQPNITWVDVSEGQVVQKGKGNSTLQINNISRPPGSAVSYVYECQAVNIHNTAAIKKKTWITVQYKAKIVTASSSTNTSSYIGQKITLTCAAEGVPVPTLEWIKPGGSPLKPGEQRNSIAVDVDLKTEGDFGLYKCSAQNTLADDVLTIYINQQKKPGQPIVTFSDEDIQASSLTIKWSSPADDGDSAVTEYRVSVPEAGFDKIYPVSDTGKETAIGPLTKNTNYTLLVYARNVVGEGQPAKESFTTKYEGAPEVVTATDESTKDPHIFTVRWTEPINNGAEVEGYDIYKRESGTDEWVKVQTLNKDARSSNISLNPGASYQIVVTATNKFGESIKENWVTIDIPPVTIATTLNVATTKGDTSGEEKAVGDRTGSGMIIGVAVGAVLFAIIAVALGFIIWRKSSHQGGKGYGSVTSRGVLSADDEGYESVSRRAAVQNLGARRDGAYADVGGDSSVYAQVDKSKKPKKPKRKPGEPGELVYADLADFSRPRGGAVPVRPEEIQRSDYADITQFSAPKQEPTYDNLPRADATYANVQGM